MPGIILHVPGISALFCQDIFTELNIKNSYKEGIKKELRECELDIGRQAFLPGLIRGGRHNSG